jgi:hypothetical protein
MPFLVNPRKTAFAGEQRAQAPSPLPICSLVALKYNRAVQPDPAFDHPAR